MFENAHIIIKEVVNEGLLQGVLAMVYLFSQANYVDNLEAKVAMGWLLEYLVLAVICFNVAMNVFLVWKLLKDLETSLPEIDDPSAHLNKKVDLFKLKERKVVQDPLFDHDLAAEIGEKERQQREDD
jgi:hypothetical protein